MLEPAIDRFGWPVRGSRVIEVREDVRPSPIQRVREFPKLNEPGRCGLFHGIDQFPESASAIAREFLPIRGHDLLVHAPGPPHVRMSGVSEYCIEPGLLFLSEEWAVSSFVDVRTLDY